MQIFSTDPRKRLIEVLTRRIQENGQENRRQLITLGSYLSLLGPEVFAQTPYAEAVQESKSLQDQLPLNRQKVYRIVQCVERSAEIKTQLQSEADAMAELEKKNTAICEEIGKTAYESYKDIPDPQGRYRGILGELRAQEMKLREVEESLASSQQAAGSGNFLSLIKEKSRSFYLKGVRALALKSLLKSYAETGRAICSSDLIERFDDGRLMQLVAPYRENLARMAEIEKRSRVLETEQETLWQELKELGAEKSHQKRVRELEKGIQGIEAKLDSLYEALGERWRSEPLRSLAGDAEIKRSLRKIAQLEKDGRKAEKQIARLEAALKVEALQDQIATMQDKIARCEQEIKRYQKEIAALSDKIARAEQEKESQIQIRGPEQTLLLLDGEGSNHGKD